MPVPGAWSEVDVETPSDVLVFAVSRRQVGDVAALVADPAVPGG